jgi:uncharacterized protein YndB with AHSA1/START domain
MNAQPRASRPDGTARPTGTSVAQPDLATPPSREFGTYKDATTLVIQRRLPGPIERVWAYLTDGDLRRQWLAAGDMTLEPGAPFELVWRNDDLSDPADASPDGAGSEHRASCTILEVEPPRKLKYDWPGAGEVTFDLAPDGDKVLLTVTHRRLTERRLVLMVGAGWHTHLDILVARIAGTPVPSFWKGWSSLRSEYERRMPPAA